MIFVYILPISITNSTQAVAGIDIIHDAILDATQSPTYYRLLMDTSDLEHSMLSALASSWHLATPDEIDRYHREVIPYYPDPDTVRARQIIATSPSAITQPQMWELIRILARRLGY